MTRRCAGDRFMEDLGELLADLAAIDLDEFERVSEKLLDLAAEVRRERLAAEEKA